MKATGLPLLSDVGQDGTPSLVSPADCSPRLATRQQPVVSVEPQLRGSLFHEHWWLSAVSGNRFSETIEVTDGRPVGRFPFIVTRRKGFKTIEMPPFTRVLGPVVDPGRGKEQTKMLRRFNIVGKLIDRLPQVHYFRQLLDVENHEVQAFLNRGFQIGIENTFRLDCRGPLEETWAGMRDKTRNLIRKSEQKYVLTSLLDPQHFIRFYVETIEKRGKRNEIDFAHFPTLLSECTARNQGEILVAQTHDGTPAAMLFLVWGNGVMYYLLSARNVEVADSGAVSLLIWEGIQRAHQKGLIFDFDGITGGAVFRFLSGFGGTIATRLVAIRSGPIFGALRYLRSQHFAGL